MTEEESFWMLVTVCEDMVPEYYNKALLGSQVDQYIFNSLVENNLKDIFVKLDKVTRRSIFQIVARSGCLWT